MVLAQFEGESKLCAVWRRGILHTHFIGDVILGGGRYRLLCLLRDSRHFIFDLGFLSRVIELLSWSVAVLVLVEAYRPLVDLV
jgi:hypothetical protein